MASTPPLRVMLVDDHEVVRDGIKALLAPNDDIVVCAEASHRPPGRRRSRPRPPRRDRHGRPAPGRQRHRGHPGHLRRPTPDPGADAHLLRRRPGPVRLAHLAGAAGYVLKQIRGDDLVQAIRTVGAGQSLLDPAVTKGVLDRLRKGKHLLKDETPRPPVTPGRAHPGTGLDRQDQQADRRGTPPGREDGQELRLQHPGQARGHPPGRSGLLPGPPHHHPRQQLTAAMATYDAAITQALDAQEDLKDHPEHCSADPARLATVGRARGQQVRIYRDASTFGLYTVSEVRPETDDTVVRDGPFRPASGSAPTPSSRGVLDSRVPRSRLSEYRARAEGELIERLSDDGGQSQLIAIAPHGGDIEPHTDDQAERVATRLAARYVSSWRCKGWKPGGGAFARWHVTSADLDEACFPPPGQGHDPGLRPRRGLPRVRRRRDPDRRHPPCPPSKRGSGRRSKRRSAGDPVRVATPPTGSAATTPAEHRQPPHRRRHRRHPDRAEPPGPRRPLVQDRRRGRRRLRRPL